MLPAPNCALSRQTLHTSTPDQPQIQQAADALQRVASVTEHVAVAAIGIQYCDQRTSYFESEDVAVALADSSVPYDPLTTLSVAGQPVHLESFSRLNVVLNVNTTTVSIDYTSAQLGQGLESYFLTTAHKLTRITIRRGQKSLCVTFSNSPLGSVA